MDVAFSTPRQGRRSMSELGKGVIPLWADRALTWRVSGASVQMGSGFISRFTADLIDPPRFLAAVQQVDALEDKGASRAGR